MTTTENRVPPPSLPPASPAPPVSRAARLARYLPRWAFAVRGSGRAPALCLTFDDGPHPEYTPRILDILKEFDCRATFFLIGENARKYPQIVRRIVEEGHSIACHTDTHVDLSGVSVTKVWGECRRSRATLEEISGQPVHHLRPPWGRMKPLTLPIALLNRMSLVLWSMDSLDSRKLSPADLTERVSNLHPKPGDILLFHDDGENTVLALPAILSNIRERRLACLTLEKVLAH